MCAKVLVFLEQREGTIKKGSLEAASVAGKMANKLGVEPEAVVLGADVNDIDRVGKFGIKKVTHLQSDELDYYSSSAYTDAIVTFAKEVGATHLFFSHSALGKDLAPRVAIRLDGGIITDCIELQNTDDTLIAKRPVYAGKAIEKVSLTTQHQVYTLRPNAFGIQETEGTAEVVVSNITEPNLSVRVKEVKTSDAKLDVAEADIIVAGGRGLKEADNFKLVEDLAEALGAAVGASRAVVDAGWRPHSEQVGQTGKTVTPTLYIACGISGAIQHLAGMTSSKYIIAINKDKEAPIFQVADYGIAGDLFEILPVLTEELKKVKE